MKMSQQKGKLALFLIILAFLSNTALTCAQTTTWTDRTGDWFAPGNWSEGVPDFITEAAINNGGTAQIGATGAAANNTFLGFDALDSGSLTISGAGTLTNSSDLFVGRAGSGMLTIQNGGTGSNSFGYIGTSTGSRGSALVDGTSSIWATKFSLFVGYFGTGTLTIQNGGAVSSSGGFIGDFGGSSGTVLVDGAGSTWTNSSRIDIGVEGTGTLTIRNGGTVSNFVGRIGGFMGRGVVMVDGADSRWMNADRLNVGDDGNGTLTILNGAAVSNFDGFIGRLSGSEGAVVVDGAHSTWTNSGSLEVGEFGSGSLTIQNAGAVSSRSGSVGGFAGSGGKVVVDGVNSTWTTTGSLVVGHGTLTVRNGGAVSSDGGFINGTALVDGAGSIWTTRGDFAVGFATLGSVTIQNGGTVSSGGFGSIGTFSGGSGAVLVDGVGSTWANDGDRLDVGFFGTGTLKIANGGVVSSAAGGVGVAEGSSGTVNVDGVGSAWNNSGDLFIGGGDRGDGGRAGGSGLVQIVRGAKVISSSITVFGHGTIFDDAFLISPNVSITAGGLLGGGGIVVGNVGNGGSIKPGDSLGTLTITGNYTQSATGNLTIGLSGLALAQYGLLSIGGSASLDGSLQLVRPNNFTPRPGETVTFLTAAGGVTGTFATVTGDFTGTMVMTEVVYELNDVRLQFLQRSFASLSGLTGNQQTVADNLDLAVSDPGASDLIDVLNQESLGSLPHDYDLIAPEELASIYEIGFSQATIQSVNLQRRLDDIRSGSNGFSAAGFAPKVTGKDYGGGKGSERTTMPNKNPDSVLLPSPENRWGVFVTGTGEFVNVGDEDSNARGYDITTGGFTLGLDYRVHSNLAIGLNAGYARSDADVVDGGRVTVDGGKLGLYATYFTGGFYIDGAVGAGWNNYDTRRVSLVGGARGETDGGEFNALIGTGYKWKFGGWSFGPTAIFQYASVAFNCFTEEGSLAPLQIEDQDEDSVRGTAGLKLSYECKAGGVIVKPEVRAAWQHEFGDNAYPIESSFASGAGRPFAVHGPALGRESALVGAGFAVQWNVRTSTHLYYDGQLGRRNYDNHNISGGVRISF